MREGRPQYAALFQAVGWLWMVGVTSLAQHAWYVHWHESEVSPWLCMVPPLVGLFLTFWLPRAQGLTGQARWLWQGVLAFATISSVIPIAFDHGEVPVLGAVSFILLWIGYALAAYQAGHIRLLNLSTAIIGLRLVIAYVEVFGSMLQTGLAMIIGGLLTLALAWVWVRKSRDFRKATKTEPTP
jgi:positive regulator of sigma E activity